MRRRRLDASTIGRMAMHVKMVFDGTAYWLLWHRESFSPPDTFPAGFHHASGPFENPQLAKEKVTADWKLIDYTVR